MVKKWANAVVVVLALVSARVVLASTSITLPNPLGSVTTLQGVTTAITNFLITIAVPLTAIMALIGGFQIITAAGNAEQVSKGRKTLMYAAIGFAIVVIAGGVVQIVKDLLGS